MQRHQEAEHERQETARGRGAAVRSRLADRVSALEDTLKGELAQLVLGGGGAKSSSAAPNATRPAHGRWSRLGPEWSTPQGEEGPRRRVDGHSGGHPGQPGRGGAEGLAHTLRDVVLVLRHVVALADAEVAPRGQWDRVHAFDGARPQVPLPVSAGPSPRHLPSLLVHAVWALVDGVEQAADAQDAAHWRREAEHSTRALEEVRRELSSLHAQQHRLAAQVDTLFREARIAGQALLAGVAVIALPWLLQRACLPFAKAARATCCCQCCPFCRRGETGRRRRRGGRDAHREKRGGDGPPPCAVGERSITERTTPPPSPMAYKGISLPAGAEAGAGGRTRGSSAAAGGGGGGDAWRGLHHESRGGAQRFDGAPPAAAALGAPEEEKWHTVRRGRRKGRS